MMPISLLLGIVGCHGNEGVGMHCAPVLGIDYSAVANAIFLFAAWGITLTLPAGLILFLLCSFAPWKSRPSVALEKVKRRVISAQQYAEENNLSLDVVVGYIEGKRLRGKLLGDSWYVEIEDE